MIDKIRGIKIQGKCFKNETEFNFYPNDSDRVALVYGKNGSGKTTISDGIAVSGNQIILPDLSAHFIDERKQPLDLGDDADKVYIFNEHYVDKNIKIDDDGLGTIILFGRQADIQAQIETAEKECDEAKGKNLAAEAEFKKYSDNNNPLSPEYHWKRIQDCLKRKGGWAETDSQIKDNRRNSSVTDDIIREICKLNTPLTSEQLKSEFEEKQQLLGKLSDTASNFPNEIKQIAFEADIESKICELLAKKIEQPILSEREKLILAIVQNGGQSSIERARDEFSKESTLYCPYCFQSVDSEYKSKLISSINAVLNKEVDEHKMELDKLPLPVFTVDYKDYAKLDDDLLTEIEKQISKCVDIVDEYVKEISNKKQNVYTPLQISAKGLKSAISELNDLLAQLEAKRIDFNKAILERKKIRDRLVEINKQLAQKEVAQLYKDFCKQSKDKCEAQERFYSTQDNLKKANEKLRILNEQKQDVGLAITNINNALDYVFFSKGRLSIELRNSKYYLKSNGNDVRPKDISLGERNIIALCYFFTQVVSNQDVANLYHQEELIVIDDPISSFDFENKVGIISFLRYQISRIVSGNDNSKILIFSHDLTSTFDLMKALDEICKSRKGIAGVTQITYSPWELHEKQIKRFEGRRSEYAVLLKEIYCYAKSESNTENLVIGNSMRRVLEAFSTFTYRKSIEDVSCDRGVLLKLGNKSKYFENLMYRLVLHNESHYEEQIYNMHDSINFYEFVSDEEKHRTAKDILCFIYLLNEQHLTAYLKDISGSIQNIKNWCAALPLNSSFEGLTEQPRRTIRKIRLYDLPLSAGLGNNIMESDISYEEFETDNEVCDFALKISGKSMEPEILDGSIVLIKQTESLENNEVGAFYYNNEVYCKRFKRSDQKISLISANPQYEEIVITENDNLYVYGKVISIIK